MSNANLEMDNNSSSYIRCIGKVCRVDTNIIKAAAKKTAHTILQPPGSRLCRSAVGTPEWPRERRTKARNPETTGSPPQELSRTIFKGTLTALNRSEPFGAPVTSAKWGSGLYPAGLLVATLALTRARAHRRRRFLTFAACH